MSLGVPEITLDKRYLEDWGKSQVCITMNVFPSKPLDAPLIQLIQFGSPETIKLSREKTEEVILDTSPWQSNVNYGNLQFF